MPSSDASTLKASLLAKLRHRQAAACEWLELRQALPTRATPVGHVTGVAEVVGTSCDGLLQRATTLGVSLQALWLGAIRVLLTRYAGPHFAHVGLCCPAGIIAVPVLCAGPQTTREMLADAEGWLRHRPCAAGALPKITVALPGAATGATLAVTPDTQLALEVRARPAAHHLQAWGRNDLFSQQSLQDLLEQLVYVAEQLASSDTVALHSLLLLPHRQRRAVLHDWNGAHEDFPVALVHQLFEAQVAATPRSIALRHGQQAVVYEDLNRRANVLAHELARLGVGPDAPVGLCVERGIEMVVGVIAILKAGGAYVPLDPQYPQERLQRMLTKAAAKVVLTQSQLLDVLPRGELTLVLLDAVHEPGSQQDGPGNLLPAGATPENLAYVIFTSGSTGQPKGIAMPHAALSNLLHWQQHDLPARGVRTLQFASLSFDVAFQEIFSTLCGGGTLVLLDEWQRRDPHALVELITKQAIQRIFVPPLVLQALSEVCHDASGTLGIDSSGELGSLRDVIVAGEQLHVSAPMRSLFRRLRHCRLHNHYGPTETHAVTALTLPLDPDQWPTLPSIGRPISNARIYVLDAQCEPAPLGVAGEIYIAGAGVARGYWNYVSLGAGRFVDDPFVSGARMYRTGDLGRHLPDGSLAYLGRNDFQVKLRGFRIELGEVEAHLREFAAVRDAVLMLRESQGEKHLVAYVVAAPELDLEELRRHLQARLPDYMLPSAWVRLDALPMTLNGKVDRQALPEPAISQPASSYVAPTTATQRALCELWQDILHLEQVGIHDNFFKLGGHSLLAMRLVASIKARLHVELAVSVLFEMPELQSLAAYLEVTGADHGTATALAEAETFRL